MTMTASGTAGVSIEPPRLPVQPSTGPLKLR
jgi:hypothetical protein